MSYQNRWRTKDNILKDLAEMTGRVGDIDDMYIVNGVRPPPSRYYEEDDDEFNLRFQHHLPECENIAPDLEGITQMLRMVNETENADDDFPVAETDNIVVSKLDPNAQEYLPKCASRKNNPDITINNNHVGKSNHNDKTKIINNSDVRSNVVDFSNVKDVKTKRNSEDNDEVEIKANKNDKKCDIKIDMNKKIDISKLDADQIKDITIKLKNKICDDAKSDDLRSKREKNVAIATLLKLHSVSPRQVTSPKHNNCNGDVKPCKLFPPEYFESSPASTNSGTNVLICEVHGIPVNIADSRAFETPVNEMSSGTRSTPVDSGLGSCICKTPSKSGFTTIPDEENSVRSIISPVSKSSDCVTSKKPNKYKKIKKPVTSKLGVVLPENNTYAVNPDVQNSIKKVNSWFQKPCSPKPKELSVCLGPVSFKRKSSPIARSPDSDAASCISTPSNSAPQIAHYKPSKYAEDLSRKFAERGKSLEQQHQDMWTQLEMQLRKKEEKK